MKKHQGFTLIEISIVLVVFGLLAAMIMKAQQMINNVKYNNWVKEIDSYRVAISSFQERYRALPGDFRFADSRLPIVPGVTPRNGNGNGMIDIVLACNGAVTNTCEATAVMQQLIVAGFISGDPTASTACVQGVIGLQCGIGTGTWGNGKMATKVIYYEVPTSFARRLDEEFDDGKANSGKVSCHIYFNGSSYAFCSGTAWPADNVVATPAIEF